MNLVLLLLLVRLSIITHAIHHEKAIDGVAFLVFGFTFVRVKYCKPTVDLGKVLMNSSLNRT